MNSSMSPSTLGELTSALERERDRIEASLHALADAERTLGASQAEEGAALGPPADVASDLAEQELDFGLEEAARRRLAEVEAALRRIAQARYGSCERCGSDVEVGRLEALPWAKFCLACANSRVGRAAQADA
ncbi:MAG: TraR/DksA C4-type zinc finger protein [Chloroflexota bacterium]